MNDIAFKPPMQTDGDRLAFLDAEKVTISIGTSLSGAEIEYSLRRKAWVTYRHRQTGNPARKEDSEYLEWSSLREAIDHVYRDQPYIQPDPEPECDRTLEDLYHVSRG